MNGTSAYITTREAKKSFGVNSDTLRRWADAELIPSIRTPGGQRMYNVAQYIKSKQPIVEPESKGERKRICYCRVSSHGQKDDLERQVTFMQDKFPNHQIISDIGSGINFRRKGLRSILEFAGKGLVEEVVVAYRDRLCRFAFELIEWLLQTNNVKLVVLNTDLDSSGKSELAEDLLSIIKYH